MSLSEARSVRLATREKTGFEAKDEDRLQERMMEQTAIGSPFHKEGPMDAKDLN